MHTEQESMHREMTAARIACTQRPKANDAATNALDYYRSNYSDKFVNHLLFEFNGRFCDDNQIGLRLFKILPAQFRFEKDPVDFDEIVSDPSYWESASSFTEE